MTGQEEGEREERCPEWKGWAGEEDLWPGEVTNQAGAAGPRGAERGQQPPAHAQAVRESAEGP